MIYILLLYFLCRLGPFHHSAFILKIFLMSIFPSFWVLPLLLKVGELLLSFHHWILSVSMLLLFSEIFCLLSLPVHFVMCFFFGGDSIFSWYCTKGGNWRQVACTGIVLYKDYGSDRAFISGTQKSRKGQNLLLLINNCVFMNESKWCLTYYGFLTILWSIKVSHMCDSSIIVLQLRLYMY